MWNLVFFFFCQKTDHGCVFICLFVCFFFQGVIESTKWSYNVARGLILTQVKSSSVLFKRPKNWRAPKPPPTLIFPKVNGSKSCDSHFGYLIWLFIFGKITMFSGLTYSPTVPGGRGCKLQTLTSVYIQ